MRNLSDSERAILTETLRDKGELFFPVSFIVSGAIAGSFFRMQRLGPKYSPRFRERIFNRISESYRCITDFLYNFGPQTIYIEPDYEGLRVRLRIRGNSTPEFQAQAGEVGDA